MAQMREFVVYQSGELVMVRFSQPEAGRPYQLRRNGSLVAGCERLEADAAHCWLVCCTNLSFLRCTQAVVDAELWAKLLMRELNTSPPIATAVADGA